MYYIIITLVIESDSINFSYLQINIHYKIFYVVNKSWILRSWILAVFPRLSRSHSQNRPNPWPRCMHCF